MEANLNPLRKPLLENGRRPLINSTVVEMEEQVSVWAAAARHTTSTARKTAYTESIAAAILEMVRR